jgi:hypothetical protein
MWMNIMQYTWVHCFGINMITGLEVGQQSIVSGILLNPNLDITLWNRSRQYNK